MFFHSYLTDLIKNRDVAAALERIKNDQEINSCTFWEQYSPLHLAIETNQPTIVDALLKAHANVNAVTYRDTLTPLHIAAGAADIRSIQELVKYNPNLNSKTHNNQDSALHIAVKQGQLGHAEVLLRAGAMVDILNKNNETAVHIAAKKGDTQMIALLLSHLANCNIHDHNEQTPLFVALMSGNSDCSALLVRNGATFGNSFEGVKKLQASYEQERAKNYSLSGDNYTLRAKLAIAENKIVDLTKQLSKLQGILAGIPTAEEVGGPSPRP